MTLTKERIEEFRELARTGKGEVNFSAADMRGLCDLALIGAAVQPRPMSAPEFFNAETQSPGVGAAFDKAAHVLSEWLNDLAPIGEARYRQPFIAALKAFNEALPQVKP